MEVVLILMAVGVCCATAGCLGFLVEDDTKAYEKFVEEKLKKEELKYKRELNKFRAEFPNKI